MKWTGIILASIIVIGVIIAISMYSSSKKSTAAADLAIAQANNQQKQGATNLDVASSFASLLGAGLNAYSSSKNGSARSANNVSAV
jgi:ATP/ADP translocase